VTGDRIRTGLLAASSLTLAGVAVAVGQAGGTWWCATFYLLACITAEASAHVYETAWREQRRTIRTAPGTAREDALAFRVDELERELSGLRATGGQNTDHAKEHTP
jgi:hypothetical protein